MERYLCIEGTINTRRRPVRESSGTFWKFLAFNECLQKMPVKLSLGYLNLCLAMIYGIGEICCPLKCVLKICGQKPQCSSMQSDLPPRASDR